MGRPGARAEFRSGILNLLAKGRSLANVVHDLDIGDETMSNWLRQNRIDSGEQPGLTTPDLGQLAGSASGSASLRRR